MSANVSDHGLGLGVIAGLRKAGGWFVFSNLVKLGAAVWATRLLDARDFALMATVLAIQGFALGLMAFSMFAELVRAKKVEEGDLRVAWSCELLRNCVIWLLLFLLAPTIAGVLGRSDAITPLRVSVTVLLISALYSPRMVELRREGKFGVLGMLDGITSLSYAVVSIVLVFAIGNYWALIAAGLLSSLVYAISTHIIRPWKPRFSIDKQRAKPMAAFGFVLLLATGVAAVRENGMVFLISGDVGDDLGVYNRALTFSFSLATMAIGLFWRVAYPVYSQHEIAGKSSLSEASKTQAWLLAVTLPLAAVGIMLRETWVTWILGTKWLVMAPIWSWLLLAGALALANAPYEVAYQAVRQERTSLLIITFSTTAQLLLAWFLLPVMGVSAAGLATAFGVLLSVILFRLISRIMPAFGQSALETSPHSHDSGL